MESMHGKATCKGCDVLELVLESGLGRDRKEQKISEFHTALTVPKWKWYDDMVLSRSGLEREEVQSNLGLA